MTRRILSFLAIFAIATPFSVALAQNVTHVEEASDVAEGALESEHVADGHGGQLTFDALLHNEHIGELWGSFLNFAILVGIFAWVIKTKVNPSLLEKREAMQEAMAEAARLKEEAEAKQREYQSRLARLDDEMASIRHEMVKAGEVERDRIVAEAEKKAARLRKDAEFVVAQRMKQLRDDLTREAVGAAVTAAERVLREKSTPEDQTRLAGAYLTRLNEVAAETAKENRA